MRSALAVPLLAVWSAAIAVAGLATVATHDDPAAAPVRTAGGTTTTQLVAPPSSETTTSVDEGVPSVPDVDSPPDLAPPSATPLLDRTGNWLVPVDGSGPMYLGDTYAEAWYDAGALFRIDPGGDLVVEGIDGSEQRYALSPTPRLNGDGTQPRKFMSATIGDERIAFRWIADDGLTGLAVATRDFTSIHELPSGGNEASISRHGNNVLVVAYDGVRLYDGDGQLRGGPFAIGDSSVAALGRWSPDDRHVMVALNSELSCVFDIADGTCQTTPLGHDHAIVANLLGDGATIACGVFDTGEEDERLAVGPYAGPLTTIVEHSRFQIASPIDDRLSYSEFPFFHRERPDRVHSVGADGASDVVVATTPSGFLATPRAYSPDGAWILVRVQDGNRSGGGSVTG